MKKKRGQIGLVTFLLPLTFLSSILGYHGEVKKAAKHMVEIPNIVPLLQFRKIRGWVSLSGKREVPPICGTLETSPPLLSNDRERLSLETTLGFF